MDRSRVALLVALGIDSFGAGLFLPLSLVYVTQVVGLPLPVAASAVTIGMLAGLGVPPLAGRLVDRLGARRVVTIAQLLQAAGALAYLQADRAVLVVLAALLLGAGQQCFYSALFALVADVVGEGPKDRPFTVVNMVRGGAFGLGALVVGGLLVSAGPPGFTVVIAVNAGCFLLAAALLTFWLDTPTPAHRTRGAARSSPTSVLRNRPYLGLIGVTGLFALATDFFLVGMPVYALTVLHTPAWLPGVLLALLTLAGATAGTVVLRGTRRLSRPAAMRLGALLVIVWCAVSATAVLVPAGWLPAYLVGCTLLVAGANLVVGGRMNAMAEAAAPSPGGAFPVTVEHAFGTTTIERPPERVVTLGVTDADPVLALGVTPVAVTGYSYYPDTGLGPWAQALVRGPQPIRLASDATPNLEQIAVLQPDLIIGVSAGFDQAVYDRLSSLAPTIARPADVAAYTVPRDQATTTIATALGRAEEGEVLLRQADEAFTEAVAAHPEFQGRTGAVVLPYDGTYGAYFPGDARGQVMADLGFVVPEPLAARDTGERFFAEVSREQLGILDGDALVVLADDPAVRAFVDGDEILQAVPVVANGGMVVPDTDTRGAMTSNSVISVPYALDRLAPALAEAMR